MNIILDKPFLLLPLFILEELGVPLPLVLSGLFIYAGYALSQGAWSAFLFVPVNLGGSLMGATGVYWAVRGGLSLPTLRRTLVNRLPSLFRPRKQSSQGWHILAVAGARLVPVPMIIITAGFATVRTPYPAFALGVLLTTLLWNVVFLSGGLGAGLVAARLPGELPAAVRYAPAAVVWIGMLVAFAVFRRRQRAKQGSEDQAALVEGRLGR